MRAALLESDPDSYYLTGHYVNHPVVLVGLLRIKVEGLRELLGASWWFVSAKRPRTRSFSLPSAIFNLLFLTSDF